MTNNAGVFATITAPDVREQLRRAVVDPQA